jgi:uncharacterized membrane protein
MFDTTHLHPMLVHFPIALITFGFIADVASLFFKSEKCLSKTGYYLMILGALSAIAAWAAGQLFTNEPSGGAIAEIFEKHETAALITIIIITTGALLRVYMVFTKKEETVIKWAVFVLYLLAFGAVTYTGFMGGTMVYNFMMSL